MGPVEQSIRGRITTPITLHTFGQSKPFVVDDVDDEGIVLLLGKGEWHTRLSWACLESVVPFLQSHPGWVPAGGKFSVAGEAGTVDQHLKRYLKRDVARWLAVVLEVAGVVQVDVGPPLRVQLSAHFGR